MKRLLLFLFFSCLHYPIFSQKIEYVAKAVFIKRESVKVNGTLNSTFGGNSRVLIEVPLPQGTIEWYFSFKTTRDKQSEDALANTIGLTTKIAALLTSSYTGGASVKFAGLAESSIKSIAISKGEVPVNVYAFDPYNAQVFLNGNGGNILNGSYNVSQSEGNSLIRSFRFGTAYIGIDNPNIRTGAWVDVEVTATILEKRVITENIETDHSYSDQSSSDTYSKQGFIGIWKDENSTFTLKEDGNFYIRWTTGRTAHARWSLNNNQLNFDFSIDASNRYKSNDYYRILSFDGTNLKYQQTINGMNGTIYNATKISQ